MFNRIFSWVADKNAGIDITASRMDTDTDDITSNGFGNTLTRDGQGSATANLPMNGFRHTGVGNGVAATDYAAMGQLQGGGINWGVATGTSDAIAVSYAPALVTLVDGQLCFFRAAAANATATPTFSPSGLTPEVITKAGGSPLVAGDIAAALAEYCLRYDLANTRWELLNPVFPSAAALNGTSRWLAAGGTSDAITAAFSPAIAALTDGQLCYLRASAANATTAPTFSPNGLAAKAITKAGGVALIAGDIPGANAEIILRYNLANTRWELLNPAQTTVTIAPPQGYLTPVSGKPIITSDSIAATSIFYTPFTGNLVPIYNGATFAMYPFAELTLALTSGAQAVNGLYDVFVFLNGAAVQVAFGPVWTAGTSGNQTPGSCARGSGTGGTALARVNGILTNAAAIAAANNGATTYAIGANLGTYVGTVYVDATAGQVTCHRSFGQNRKFGIWNAFNRAPISLLVGDTTVSWNYGTNTFRASNNVPTSYSATEFNVGSGTACNGCLVLTGLAEEPVTAEFRQSVNGNVAGNASGRVGVGLNSITVLSGMAGVGTGGTSPASITAGEFIDVPALGLNVYACVEAAVGSAVFSGTNGFMQMSVSFRG